MDDFIALYCSEPRIAFNKTVVLRYRIHLEAKHLAPATINLRLAAVRRLAYEAADVGLFSPYLADGVGESRVRSVWVSGWATGSARNKRKKCSGAQTET